MRILLLGEVMCLREPVRYYLLVEELDGEKEQYGVCVSYREEKVRLPGLTVSQRAVQELLGTLIRGRVTPVSVPAVVDDWLLR